MRRVNMTEWTDLLAYAETIGISWNAAHDIVYKANIIPTYDMPTTDIYPGVCEAYGWTGDVKKIVDGYLQSVGNKSVTLTN